MKVKLASLSASAGRTEEVSLLVATGSTLSWIPREILERLGVAPVSRMPFTRADGRTLERDTTAVLLTIDGRKGAVPVAFGEPGEEAVLGATALETLGLIVDPVAQKLVPRSLRETLHCFTASHALLERALDPSLDLEGEAAEAGLTAERKAPPGGYMVTGNEPKAVYN